MISRKEIEIAAIPLPIVFVYATEMLSGSISAYIINERRKSNLGRISTFVNTKGQPVVSSNKESRTAKYKKKSHK
jgi:hypothetical protein